MRPKTIGIIGGAGPLAAVTLLEQILCFAQLLYGCYRDRDFPKIYLISFPFSEMLEPNISVKQVQEELKNALNELRGMGAAVLAIACNTLHSFLAENEEDERLIHLPKVLARNLSHLDRSLPLVLCTSTSVRFNLHRRFFPCLYPDPPFQRELDQMIARILKGEERKAIAEQLKEMIRMQGVNTVVLGCTELSLISHQLNGLSQKIIDPLTLVAKEILTVSFTKP